MTLEFVQNTADALERSIAAVVCAPPGAGKTTRIPHALLSAPFLAGKEVLVLEPRRLAASMSARYVAGLCHEPVGQTVGYQVRFEEARSSGTRLLFMTEGVFLRRLLDDGQLSGVGAVVLDEFHERHAASDVALAMVRRLQKSTRPDLKLVVMSATLEHATVLSFLDDCPLIQAEVPTYEVKVEHDKLPSRDPLPAQVSRAVRRLLKEEPTGDILVFLPGVGEIHAAMKALSSGTEAQVLPLHGSLTVAEQEKAIAPQSGGRKVILATNVAETSITIEGVVAVVDSGLARVAGFHPWSGLPTLELKSISQASAIQRAGRAGRVRPGRCVRLYTQHDFKARLAHSVPEILRQDLADTVLLLHGLGVTSLQAFAWLDVPKQTALDAAVELLMELGALDKDHRLTAQGRRMLHLPLHPRLAAMLLAAAERGQPRAGAVLAALLSERIAPPKPNEEYDLTDPLTYVEALGALDGRKLSSSELAHMGLPGRSVQTIERSVRQLMQRLPNSAPQTTGSPEEALHKAVLQAFPDRVAKRSEKGPLLQLVDGRFARLPPQAVHFAPEYGVALDVEQRTVKGRSEPQVRFYSQIEAEWLLELFPDKIAEKEEHVWNAAAQRVERVSSMAYGAVVLYESRTSDVEPAMAAPLLVQALEKIGVEEIFGTEQVANLRTRLSLLAKYDDTTEPALDADTLHAALLRLCEGATSFSQVRSMNPSAMLTSLLGHDTQRKLEQLTPSHITLTGGRRLEVHYSPEQEPWVASYLQDFFGCQHGPAILHGRLPLVLHLWAPNRRAVQVTSDLQGFWQRHYPELRRTLARRYPKHAWPDDPLTAKPPPLRRRRA